MKDAQVPAPEQPAPDRSAPGQPASDRSAPGQPAPDQPAQAVPSGGTASRWAGLLDELGVPASVIASAPGSPGPGVVPSGGECAEALGQMFEYLDGEIDNAVTASRIGEHLQLCTSCLAAYDTEKLVRAALVRSCRADTASPELRTRISVLIRAGGDLHR